jgi:predicted acyl esterase
MYLTWLGEHSTRSEVAEVMRGRVAEELLSLDPVRLTIDVWDPESDIPAPVPTPAGETPLHGVISLWVDSIEQRAPFEEVLHAAAVRLAGYSVVESLYRDYGGNQWGAPRSWPDGERSPGVLTVALLQQHPDQSFDEWMTRWQTRISPITEEIQPRTRYVRNAVFRPITDGAPLVSGIVEEAWPSLAHVTDPMLFYCAEGDPEKMNANITQMIEEINAFVDLSTLRSVTMSEWILKS